MDQYAVLLEMVANEIARARAKHAPINSAHDGYAVILEELDEFKAEVWKKRNERDRENMLTELVQCTAMCIRTAVDTGLMED
jgi:hypothetical protein